MERVKIIQGNKKIVLNKLDNCLPAASSARRIGIKINLQSPPKAQAPRTDTGFLFDVIMLLVHRGNFVTIFEGANGHLQDNLIYIGLRDLLALPEVTVIDIDLERQVTYYKRDGKEYAIPDILGRQDIRIALPCASKRPGYLFSCNVKTFVGLIPRCYCASEHKEFARFSRPMIHEDLTKSVSDIFSLFKTYMPFHYYLNGGNVFSEFSSLTQLPDYYLSDNAVDLDFIISKCLNSPVPDYLIRSKLFQEEESNESL